MARKALKEPTFDADKMTAFLSLVNDLEAKGAPILKMDVEERFTPTRSIVLDNVLRLKGLPRGGRMIHIHGKEHGGKSTICYFLAKSYQLQEHEPVVIFDFEGTTTANYLTLQGVDTDRRSIVVIRSFSIEDCIKETLQFMMAGVKLFIFDSVPKMNSKASIKDILSGQAMKQTVGQHARGIKSFLDILQPHAMEHDCLFIMVNQVRARIEMTHEAMMASKYPSITNLPYIVPGGNSIRFASSLSLEVGVVKAYKAGKHDADPFLIEQDDGKGGYVATKIKVRVIKNKVTTGGYREYFMWLRPGLGVDDWISVRELARNYNLITNKGRRWIVGDPESPIAEYESKEDAIRDLVTDPDYDVLTKLRLLVQEHIGKDKSNFGTSLTEYDRVLAGDVDESPEASQALMFDDDEEEV